MVTELVHKIIDAYAGLGTWTQVGLVVGIAAVTTAGGMLVLVRMPADHFCDRRPGAVDPRWRRHPVTRVVFKVAKNLLGLVILPLGIIMSLPLVPGPGLVFLLLGLSLLDFPGKRALERRLVRHPLVLRVLNQTRARFGRPPFVVDADEPKGHDNGRGKSDKAGDVKAVDRA
jgi:hypothetical protein